MPALVNILTAAMLVTHLFAGCCAHHAHACDEVADLGNPAALRHTSDTLHPGCSLGTLSQANHPQEGAAGHPHHGHDNCQGLKCSFLRAGHEGTRTFFVQLAQTSVAPLLDEPFSPLGISSQRRFLPSGRLLLAVRLHLVHQVMLI